VDSVRSKLRLAQPLHRRSPLSTAETRRMSAWRSEFCIEAGHTYQPRELTDPSPEPTRLFPLNA